jgi:2,3-dihydroxybenzoate-AMP ligase
MLNGCVPWPAQHAERYRREGYWRGEALGDVLRSAVASNEDRVALATAEQNWTFADVDARADRLASGLARIGLRPRDRVVVQLPNIPEFVVVTLALFRLGALPVFALPAHRVSEITYICELAGATAYVVTDTHRRFDYRTLAQDVTRRVALKHVLVAGDAAEFTTLNDLTDQPRELPAPDPADVAFFLLSGGTTGMPKLIPRTHDDYAYQLRATAEALGIGPTSVYLATLPIAHNAALGCPGVLGTYLAGGKTVLASSPAPDEVFPLVAHQGATFTTLMPPVVKMWIDSAPLFDVHLSGLLLQIGSAKLPIEVARQIRPVLGCEMTHWFGMAEGLLTCTRLGDPDDIVFSTTGRPLCPADEIKVVDEAGIELGPNQIGELMTRGPYTLRGYYRAAEHNARTFTPDGWFHTGDLVRLTEDGNMIVEGRVKDVINRGGEKVSPAEIEGHLLAHPDVQDVSVVGVPDSTLGEKTCACVIAPGERPRLADLRRFLIDRGLASYKLPDQLEYVQAFPHTRVGKVNKAELSRQIVEAAGATAVP